MSIKLDNLRQKFDQDDLGLDAILISSPENRRYMSGFTGSAGWLLISRDDATLATDFPLCGTGGQAVPRLSHPPHGARLGLVPRMDGGA